MKFQIGQAVTVTTKRGNVFSAVIESVTLAGDTDWSEISDLFDPPSENEYTVLYRDGQNKSRRQVVPESWITLK